LLFSFSELTRESSPLPLAGTFWFLESLEAVDDFSVRGVVSETPDAIMESFEALPLLPAHLLNDPSDQERWNRFAQNPIGCGPYRIERRRSDGGIVLRAFNEYFGATPRQEWNVYRRFDSLESKLLALRSERVDCLVPDERFSDWALRNPGQVRQIRCLPRFQYFVAWNLDVEPLDQNEVRSALAMSVDLNAVLTETATSYQQPVRSLFFPGVSYVSKAMPLPLLDLREAEHLLDEAGYPFDESQGARVREDGVVLAIELSVNEGDPEQIRLARALQNQWAAIGVVVKIEEIPWAAILEDRLLTRDFQGVMLSWEIPLKRDRYETFHSRGIEEGGGNLFGLRNQVVDELLGNLRVESRPEMLSTVAHRLQDEIAALQPCLFIGESGRIITVRDEAVEVVREVGGEDLIRSPAGIGKAGLERSRPRWARRSDEEPAEKTIEEAVE
ncbi:MAG: ABC transporter substrate-binding protein, partial [Verrucomicrobiota bacterium]